MTAADSTLFSTLNLPQALLDNLQTLGYKNMTPVQQGSLPVLLNGQDVLAKAKTGSGKTAAFGIGIVMSLNPRDFGCQALVMCPTRELATQVANEIRKLARFQQNIKVVTLCGGQPIGPQIGSLEHGAHVVVGTPGRINDHLRKGTLSIERTKMLVLDEADRMLDMGFIDAMESIIELMPQQRQTLLFSATYPAGIQKLSSRFQNKPVEVTVEATHSQQYIEQYFIQASNEKKPEVLVRLLQHYNPASAVIFCNTKHTCKEVGSHLYEAGFRPVVMHGDLDQKERDQMLVRFANGSATLLIATDVAARGLDIESLAAVFNYDLSRDSQVHTHRVGRTGRAGKHGLAVSLYTQSEQYKLEAIEDQQRAPLNYLAPAALQKNSEAAPAPMVTLAIAGGKKQKVRPGDILGALTGEGGIAGAMVGKINVYDFVAYVAVNRDVARQALQRLESGKIKGRHFKVRRL